MFNDFITIKAQIPPRSIKKTHVYDQHAIPEKWLKHGCVAFVQYQKILLLRKKIVTAKVEWRKSE